MDNDRNVLVIISSKQCGYCKKIPPMLNEMINLLPKKSDFIYIDNATMFSQEINPLPKKLSTISFYPFIFKTETIIWQDFLNGNEDRFKDFDVVNCSYDENLKDFFPKDRNFDCSYDENLKDFFPKDRIFDIYNVKSLLSWFNNE